MNNETTPKTAPAQITQSARGGWYIAIGQPGFNSPTNNRGGYKTEAAALKALALYAARGRKVS